MVTLQHYTQDRESMINEIKDLGRKLYKLANKRHLTYKEEKQMGLIQNRLNVLDTRLDCM